MVNKEIVEYIRKNSKRGISSQRIHQSLLAQGKSDYEIKEAKNFIDSGKEFPKENKTNVVYSESFFYSDFFKYIVGFLVLVLVFVLIYLIVPKGESFSSKEIENGTSLELTKNNVRVKFEDGQDNLFFSRKKQEVEYTFRDSKKFLSPGIEENLDLNGDGIDDLIMVYEGVDDRKIPLISFKKIIPCVPDWECEDWRDCVDGTQTRICVDENSCGSLDDRPFLQKTCTIVEEEEFFENETKENETEEEEENETEVNETEVNETTILLCEGFVNRTEIGGDNLTAGTVYGFAEVNSEGVFESNMSGEGAQLGMVLEGEDLRATAISLGSCDESWIFDADSTAKAQIFLSLGFLSNTEVDSARLELESIGQLESFGNFSSYLGNNLHNCSLSSLAENPDYINHLNTSIVEMSCLLELDLFPCD